jgi:hypothetical protein
LKDRLVATDFDLDVAGLMGIGRLQCNGNQGGRRTARWRTAAIDTDYCRHAGQLLIAVRFDPAAQEIGIELVSQGNCGD